MIKYWLTCLLIIILPVAAVTGCAVATPADSSYPIEITDQLGRLVSLSEVPRRIISLAPSNTEILYALGLEDKIVGVTRHDDYPPEVKEKPDIGGFFTPGLEAVVSLDPDLILATAVHEDEFISMLTEHGLTVVALDPKTLNEVFEAIAMVARLTGREQAATGLLTGMQARVQSITAKTGTLAETQRPRVFYITWHDPLQTAGSGNLGDDLITLAGGTNIFHDQEDAVFITLKRVVYQNPEAIIAVTGMGTGIELTLDLALNEPTLRDTDARKNQRIYAVHVDLTGRPGPRIVAGLEQLARFIHPELFNEAN